MIAGMAAVEIPATHAGQRAFVGVYPPLPKKGIDQWRVRRFEIPTDLVNEYVGEEQLRDSQFVYLETLQAVEDLLVKWELDGSAFEEPWKIDYPL
jgi:hypothetical protein